MTEMSEEFHHPHINGDYESLEEPEEFFLWPFLRIVFGIVLMAIELAAVLYLARLWTKDYDRLSAIDANPQTPVKFFLQNMTVSGYQGNRSTSWAFATISTLQQSYYEDGIESGFLPADTEVQFSVQAYAITVLNECENNTNVCKEAGKGAVNNSTENGDIAWFMYLDNLQDRVLPNAICEYQNETEGEFTCDNLTSYLDSNKNPLHFTIENSTMAYETTAVKELLYRKSRAMPLQMGTSKVHWTIPCPEGGITADEDTDGTYSHYCQRVSTLGLSSVSCPSGIAKHATSDVCYTLEESPVTLDGEYITNLHPHPDGEHAVTVVGWNDEQMSSPIPRRDPSWGELPGQRMSKTAYASENAQGIASSMGGFIVQDSLPGPSHSMLYWVGNVSTWDERFICPNPEYPRNWLSCTSIANVTHRHAYSTSSRSQITRRDLRRVASQSNIHPHSSIRSSQQRHNDDMAVAMCAQDNEYMEDLLQKLRQPYEYECVNYTDSDGSTYTLYNCNTSNRYFLSEFEVDRNGLVTGNFYAVPSSDNTTSEEYTLRQLTEREIANTLQPLTSHKAVLENDATNCGYHFLPYHYLDISSMFQRWYAIHYNITWKEYSFTNAQKSSYDYSLLKKSKIDRTRLWFDGPLPLANGTREEL